VYLVGGRLSGCAAAERSSCALRISAKTLIYPVQKIMSAAKFITMHAFILQNV
jgi:hypothetical protein